MNDLKAHIAGLARSLGTGRVDPVAYDTAFVARVPALDAPGRPAFPEALDWLRAHQNPDGTWGPGEPLHAHSITLETLAAGLALRQWGHPEDERRFQRAMEALPKLAARLDEEPYESVGFELLLPALTAEASEA